MSGQGATIEERAVAAAIAEVAMEGAAPATTVQLFPIGAVMPNDGRAPWRIEDQAHAQRVVEATRAHLGSRDFMFDYDHQAERAPRRAGKAVASGWVKPDDIYADEKGVWARNVRWTSTAAAHLADREYRYLSPWFAFEKATRRVTRFFNAALTNTPALELAAVAAQSHGDPDDMKAIATALGLAEDATEAQILDSISTIKTDAAAVASALGLAAAATGEELATAAAAAVAVAAADPDPSKFVPISELQSANAKLDAIRTKDGEAAVDSAIAAGKLTPANRDWGLKAYRADPESFATAMGNQPTVLKPGEEANNGGGDAAPLTDQEKALCASLGISEEDFVAERQTEQDAN